MTNAGRTATVALVAAMGLMVTGQANAQDELTAGNPRAAADSEAPGLTIQLQLLNDANVPADILESARQQLSAIYARAGIELIRHDTPAAAPSALRFAAKIVPHSLGYGRDKPHVMGAAPGETRGTLVYVFFGRVEKFARSQRVLSSTMLAHVIAHEIGHLLLPKGWHSERGLMRDTWDRAQVDHAVRNELTFTKDEIRTIRADASFR
jgi:hypothetical protein